MKFRWLVLLTASLGFYWIICDNSIIAFSILIGMSLVSWLLSLLMDKKDGSRKPILVISLLFIALPLLAFKEFGYIFNTFFHKSTPLWWIAPIGFSFYTMQLIAYVSDVYQKKTEPEKNYLKFLLFVSYFPQIIQGPIPRHKQLGAQLIVGHRFDENKFVKGFMMILWGFFLKLCIADKAGIAVDTIFDNFPTYQGFYILVGGILYSFQLYADFLACTSFAKGFSELVGIDIIDNFARPYFAVSVKDFWRRWHISLSSWLKDYIYIPLGGNRKGAFR
ncbi:MAG: MBOAT family protein, partial [Lachnospiraceae bacterium]|nr:MBOAT family protein [Lachnospiraceae bacterium]